MKKKSLTSNAIYNVLRTFITLVFPLITFMYASRILDADGIGKVEFSKNIAGYFVLIASLGINNYGIREGAKRRDNIDAFSKFVHEILMINTISMVVALALYLSTVFNVNYFENYQELLLVFSSMIVFTPLGVEWLYSAEEEYRYITLRTLFVQILAVCILFLFVKDADDCLWYSVVLVISSVGANIFNIFHMRKFVKFKRYAHYSIRKHLKPIFIMFAMALSNNLYSYIDTTMLGFINGDTEVGLYSAALKINRVIVNVLGAVGAVSMPRFSYLWYKDEREAFYKLAETVLNILLMLSIPCCIGMILVSESAVLLFSGSGFLAADLTTKLLAPIIVILTLSTFFNMHIFIPLNKEKYTVISILMGLVVNVTINSILMPQYGKNGAAIGTVIGEGVVLITALIFARKQLRLKKMFSYLYQYIISTLVIIPICLIFDKYISSLVLRCLLSVAVSGAFYFAILYFVFNNLYLRQGIKLVLKKIRGE